jgi:hypothetical protein
MSLPEGRRHGEAQCELSIVTSTELHSFLEQHRMDRAACEERYARDRQDAKEFREKILTEIKGLNDMLTEFAPSIRVGKKIAWGVVATVAVSFLSAIPWLTWKAIKFVVKYSQ